MKHRECFIRAMQKCSLPEMPPTTSRSELCDEASRVLYTSDAEVFFTRDAAYNNISTRS
jgi:hypothetical protein